YERNLALEGKLITREKDYWENNVLAGVCPEPQTPHDILALYKETKSNPIIADIEIAEDVDAYDWFSRQIKHYENMRDQLKEKIQMYMQDADTLVNNSGKMLATWRYTKPIGSFDMVAFKKAQPDVYKLFYKEGTDGKNDTVDNRQRRFNLKGDKDGRE